MMQQQKKLEIGPYKKDATAKEAYFYIDMYDLCVVYKENGGKGDSIGKTLLAWLAYHDDDLVQGVMNLWAYREEYNNKYMTGVRHPTLDTSEGRYASGYWKNRMSRDHYTYTLILLRLWEKRNMMKLDKLKEIVNATPFKIRKMARWTLPLILWSKSLIGNKRAEWWWLILDIITVRLIYVPLHKLGYKLTGWKEEVDQDEWNWTTKTRIDEKSREWLEHRFLKAQPKWKQTIDKIIYPSYAISFAALQIYASNNNFPKLKKYLQKSYLKMVGKTNYYQRMLLGEKNIPRDKIESYLSMSGGRWNGYLSDRNDRTLCTFEPQHEYNQIDRDVIRAIYNETQL